MPTTVNRGDEMKKAFTHFGDVVANSVNMLVNKGKVDIDDLANSAIRVSELGFSIALETIQEQKEKAMQLIKEITNEEKIADLQEKVQKLEKEIEKMKSTS